MVEKTLVFIEENSGIGKNSGKPYHLLKLADPITYQNHVISYDPAYMNVEAVQKGFKAGDKIILEGRLHTPYKDTQFIATQIKKAN